VKECDGEGRGCWAYAAERPGFSIVEVLFIHVLCSRRKVLALPHISSALRQGGHLVGSEQIRRRLLQITRWQDVRYHQRSHIFKFLYITRFSYQKKLQNSRAFFCVVYSIHTASAPSTTGTHPDGGAVMRRTEVAEERHYWRPSRSFKNVDAVLHPGLHSPSKWVLSFVGEFRAVFK